METYSSLQERQNYSVGYVTSLKCPNRILQAEVSESFWVGGAGMGSNCCAHGLLYVHRGRSSEEVLKLGAAVQLTQHCHLAEWDWPPGPSKVWGGVNYMDHGSGGHAAQSMHWVGAGVQSFTWPCIAPPVRWHLAQV